MVQMAKLWPAPAPTWSEVVRNRCQIILIIFRYHPTLWKFALKCIPGAGGAPDLPLDVGGHISEGHPRIWIFFCIFTLVRPPWACGKWSCGWSNFCNSYLVLLAAQWLHYPFQFTPITYLMIYLNNWPIYQKNLVKKAFWEALISDFWPKSGQIKNFYYIDPLQYTPL